MINPQRQRKPGDSSSQPRPPYSRWPIWIYIIIFGGMLAVYFFSPDSAGMKEITWKEFEESMLSDQDVEKVDVVNNERVEVYLKSESLDKPQYDDIPQQAFSNKPVQGPHYYFNIGSVEVFHEQLADAQENFAPDEKISVTYSKQEDWWGTALAWLFPIAIFFFLWMFIFRRMSGSSGGMGSSIFNFGQSKAKVFEKDTKSKVTFDDVAGLEEPKQEITEIVKFLKSPGKFTKLGAKIPKGLLLVGPPGTGKTLLARAVAGEADVPFFSLSGSEFIEMFVGVGASRMRDLFQKAKAKAPSIIFIDEIDTIGRARGKAGAFQANDERESTLNQLLAELDGFDPQTGVIVLAATNRGDILDTALLRPGRFDRHIHLELPNMNERKAIFKVHMKPLRLSDKVDVEQLAAQTPGFSGADIANVCNEAALIAARNDKEKIDRKDFSDAIDRIVGGIEKRTKIISPEEKRVVAYHEAGHVTASWFLKHAHPVLKVSIIPRGKSLGAAWYTPQEHQIVTRSQFFDSICMALGGRAAEELVFNEISSNALDDLEKTTKLAYNMVAMYGLSEALKNISYYDSTGQAEQLMQKPYSEKTARVIDEEVQKIINKAYERTQNILKEHRKELDMLAEKLIGKEILFKQDVEKILGKQKFQEEEAHVLH